MGEGFADWFRRFPRIVASPRSFQKRVQKRVFLGGAPALPASFRMMRMMLCMNEMKVKGSARKSRGHWRETEMQENARAEREEPDSGNEKGKECE